MKNLYIIILLTFGFSQDYSLSFDGVGDYVDVGSGGVGSAPNELTQEAWIKTTITGNSHNVIMTKRHHGWGPDWVTLGVDGNTGQAIFGFDGDHYWDGIESTINVADDSWHYVVGTKNGNTINLYVDGIFQSTKTASHPFGSSYNLHIGRSGAWDQIDHPNNFNGKISDVRIWDIELSLSDIQNYMNSPPIGNESGLVGYWIFNQSVIDQTQNGNDGIINGDPIYSTDVPIQGCTDPCMENYNPEANFDDGSCAEFIGCPDNGDYSLSFDGVDDWVEIINSQDLLENNYHTIEVWLTQVNSTELVQDIVSKDGEGFDRQWLFEIKQGLQILQSAVWGTNNSYSAIQSENQITYHDEYHLVQMWDGQNLKIFINGEEESSTSANYILAEGNQPIRLGGGAAENFQALHFNGKMHEVRLWNRALTNYEINNSFNHIDIDDSQLEVDYKFNAGISDTLYDHSGNGNHGMINGATWAGCTDENSCDYLPNAVIDDGSCVIYPDCAGVCYGDSYEDECGTCDDDPANDCFDYCLDLHSGANLVSFYGLPDDASIANVMSSVEGIATGVIGEGVAANYNGTDWLGSLNTISSLSGYWVIVSEADLLCIEDGNPTDPTIQYSLHSGANLISFPVEGSVEVSSSLPDDIEGFVSGIIGEGVAANNQPPWQGSLSNLNGGNGYWMITTENISFSFDVSTMSRIKFDDEVGLTAPDNKEIHQSTKQAFYFIESIENIEVGDWILAYNGDKVIGAREWQGSIIDVPAMGDDGSDYTKGHMETGEVPSFKILRGDELINLEGDIPAFENNQLFMVSNLTEAVALPETFSLDRAYPNPFNPVTTLSFALPVTSNVLLEVYDINGRLINELIKSNMDAGYHSVIWNADNNASGVYFVKMIAGDYVSSQKLMLIK